MIKSWTAEKLKVEDKKQISQSGIPVWEKERYYNPAGMDITDNVMNPYNPKNELYKLNEDNRPWIYKHLPGTTEVGEELLVNPLSIPQKREKPTEPFARATVELMGPRIANPILDAFGSIKDAFKAEVQNIKDLVQPPQKKMSVDDHLILSSHYSLLAPKAIGAGAGVIKLFFESLSRNLRLLRRESSCKSHTANPKKSGAYNNG